LLPVVGIINVELRVRSDQLRCCESGSWLFSENGSGYRQEFLCPITRNYEVHYIPFQTPMNDFYSSREASSQPHSENIQLFKT
jgi:hypothetical protein